MKTLTDIWNDVAIPKPCILENGDGYILVLSAKLADGLYQGSALTPVSSTIYLSKGTVTLVDDDVPAWSPVQA